MVALPAVKKRFEDLGIEAIGSTPEQFDAYLKLVSGKWGKLIAEQNIAVD